MNTLERTSQKITLTLLAGQSLLSASTIMAFTVGAILAVELANNDGRWTGVPSTLVVVGAALVAYPVGRLMDKIGRRLGLSLGYVFGIIGMLVAGSGVLTGSLWIFLLGFFLLGLTRGVLDQGRYAAGEASPTHKRARAISWVVLGGTAGSILGPGFISFTTATATRFGLPPMSGPWFLGAVLFSIGLILMTVFLRPDPQEVGRQLAALEPVTALSQQQGISRPYREIFRNPNVILAVGTLIFAQVTMVVVMVVTPVHMHSHQHALSSISLVIMAHTLGMFGLSFLTGWLVDKLGRAKIIIAGGLVLSLACFMAPFSFSVPWLALALFLLGLGWNFCFVAGSTLLSDMLRSAERGRVQGLSDTLVNASSALGNLSSGLIFATFGFATMSWLTILLGMIPVVLVILSRTARHKLLVEEMVGYNA